MNLIKKIVCIIGLPVCLIAGEQKIYKEYQENVEIIGSEQLELKLNIETGCLNVLKHSQSRVVRVELKYCEEHSTIEVQYQEKKNRLIIELDHESWTKKTKYNSGQDHEACTVYLPDDIEMKIDASLKAGDLDMQLGGIPICAFDLSMWAGEADVYFDEPNPAVMKMLDINTRVGEYNLHHLGNARFKRADINGGIGELNVDLTGNILNESRVKVDLDIGEATVILPRHIEIMMGIQGMFSFMSSKNIDRELIKRGSRYYTEHFDEGDEKFYIRVTPGLGELNIEME